MTPALAKSIAAKAAVALVALLIFAALLFALVRLFPRENPLPANLARKDEKAAAGSAQAIGGQIERQNRDATINIDLTTKEIHDAFDALPPAAAPVAGEPARALPPAPVDRVRDRLNESIARANRSAGDASAPD